MNEKRMPASNIGTVSLLMIFIVLCLVVFATLSLSNTVGEYRYSTRLAESDAAYNAAEETAAEILMQADQAFDAAYAACQETGGDAAAYYACAKKLLPDYAPDGALAVENGAATFSYEVNIDESHVLCVELTLMFPADDESGYYRITRWQKETR